MSGSIDATDNKKLLVQESSNIPDIGFEPMSTPHNDSNVLTQPAEVAPYIRESVANRASTGLRVLYVDDREQTTIDSEDKRGYKGRIRTWPGLLLLFIIVVVGAVLITWAAFRTHTDRNKQANLAIMAELRKRRIGGGSGGNLTDIISDDGQVGNPKVYPSKGCELPNYLSQNGQIYAVSSNGTQVPLRIKGVNWFGMETGLAVPFGLWDNEVNGTTAYEIAAFLARNRVNSVRLPVCIQNILENVVPQASIVNRQTNRALNLQSYLSLLKSIIQVLGYRQISVLISLHTLTQTNTPPDGLWYNAQYSENDFLSAVDILTKNLCTSDYWNIVGIDLKNEPWTATWGTGDKTDFRRGAQLIGNRMLTGCPKWLGFVEGIFLNGDWWGASLQGAKTAPVEFALPNKVVYAPHFYTPAVYPHTYFFKSGSGTSVGGVLKGYVEVNDATLKKQIEEKINDMFGFLATTTGPALIMGEIGGLYATDAHPLKTTQRAVNMTMELATEPGYGGAYIWSLNPESAYQFNPADTPGNFVEGLLQVDWLHANEVFMRGITILDNQPNLQMFPCFPTTKKK